MTKLPASLLACVAWQSGNGALANVALDRALADNPDYEMAHILRRIVDCGMGPFEGQAAHDSRASSRVIYERSEEISTDSRPDGCPWRRIGGHHAIMR